MSSVLILAIAYCTLYATRLFNDGEVESS
jgi:hypothetical protein